MVRVRKEPHATVASGSVRHKEAGRTSPSYKVVYEQLTRERKLKIYLTTNINPPKGYTFIPAGDPQLTRRCKKVSKEMEMAVYVVSIRQSERSDLTKEITRIGFHFSTFVVEKACQSLGVTLNAAGRVAQSQFAVLDDSVSKLTSKLQKPKAKDQHNLLGIDSTLSQAMIDSQARDAIRDLFPRIPERDLHEIIIRAFDKRKGLVGVAEASLARRANLAVGAHIRHTYTNYDELLRSGVSWSDARRGVEPFTLDKLVSWRGEEDDDPILDEVLREVIVISDNETKTADDNMREPSIHDLNPEEIRLDKVEATAIDLTIEDDEETEGQTGPYSVDPYLMQTEGRSQQAVREARSQKERHSRWAQALNRSKRGGNVSTNPAPPLIPGLDSYNQSILTSRRDRSPGKLTGSSNTNTASANNTRESDNLLPHEIAPKNVGLRPTNVAKSVDQGQLSEFTTSQGRDRYGNTLPINSPAKREAPGIAVANNSLHSASMAGANLWERQKSSNVYYDTNDITRYSKTEEMPSFMTSSTGLTTPGVTVRNQGASALTHLSRSRKPQTVLIPLDTPVEENRMAVDKFDESKSTREFLTTYQVNPTAYNSNPFSIGRGAERSITSHGSNQTLVEHPYALTSSTIPRQLGRSHQPYEVLNQMPGFDKTPIQVPRLVHLPSTEDVRSRSGQVHARSITFPNTRTVQPIPRMVRLGPDGNDSLRTADQQRRQEQTSLLQQAAPGTQIMLRKGYSQDWHNREGDSHFNTPVMVHSNHDMRDTRRRPHEIVFLDD